MVAWLIFYKKLDIDTSIEGLLLVQIPYLMYILIVRPMDSKKNNMVEIINEIFLTLIISFLSYFKSESDWNDFNTDVFTFIVLGNTMVITLLLAGKALFLKI